MRIGSFHHPVPSVMRRKAFNPEGSGDFTRFVAHFPRPTTPACTCPRPLGRGWRSIAEFRLGVRSEVETGAESVMMDSGASNEPRFDSLRCRLRSAKQTGRVGDARCQAHPVGGAVLRCKQGAPARTRRRWSSNWDRPVMRIVKRPPRPSSESAGQPWLPCAALAIRATPRYATRAGASAQKIENALLTQPTRASARLPKRPTPRGRQVPQLADRVPDRAVSGEPAEMAAATGQPARVGGQSISGRRSTSSAILPACNTMRTCTAISATASRSLP